MTTLGPQRFGGGFGRGPGGGLGLTPFARKAPTQDMSRGIGRSAPSATPPTPQPALTPAQSAARRETQQMLAAYTKEKQSEIDPAFKETLMEFGITEPEGIDKSLGGIAMARLNVRSNSDASSSVSSPFAGSREMMFGVSTQGDFVESSPRGDEPALKMSENGFAIKSSDRMDDLEKLTRNVNRILNKLTPEKYDNLAPQLYDLDLGVITNVEYMEKTIELLFSRAIAQPAFVEMYAKLAEDLAREEAQYQKARAQPGAKVVSEFRKKLLTVVQRNYTNTKEQLEKEGEQVDTEQVRKRKFGNVRFVGELFNKSVLPHTIVYMLFRQLLCLTPSCDPDPKQDPPTGEDLEVLCKLLTTTGKCFESHLSRSRNEQAATVQEGYNKVFEHMERIAEGNFGKYELRIRITLVNTIDLRKKGWPVKIEVAKKLEDLERENEEKERRRREASGWNNAAEVAPALIQAQKEKDTKKKNKKKKNNNNDDDGWGTVKGSTRTETHTQNVNKNQPRTTAGGFAALGRAEKVKPSKQEKAKEKKKEKKEKEAKKAKKDEEEDKKGSRLPVPAPEGFSHKVKNRAVECMEQQDDEHKEIVGEDFDHYKTLGIEEYAPLVVMELLKALTTMRDEAQRKAVVGYTLIALGEGHVKKDDVMRGVGWFLFYVVSERLYEDMPAVYKRGGEAVKALFPMDAAQNWIDMTKAFQHAFRAITKWWDHTAEDDRPVESADELYDEITENAWKAMNRGLGAFWEDALLGNVVTLSAKSKFPMVNEDTYVLRVMVEHLIDEGVVTQEHVRAHISTSSGGKAEQVVKILRAVAGDVEGEEEAEVEEAEEAEEQEEA